MHVLMILLLSLSCLLTACGESTDTGNNDTGTNEPGATGTTDATADDVAALCLAYCEKLSDCDPGNPMADEDLAECTNSCADPSVLPTDSICLGYVADALTCATALSCEDILLGNQDQLCVPDDLPEDCLFDDETAMEQ